MTTKINRHKAVHEANFYQVSLGFRNNVNVLILSAKRSSAINSSCLQAISFARRESTKSWAQSQTIG